MLLRRRRVRFARFTLDNYYYYHCRPPRTDAQNIVLFFSAELYRTGTAYFNRGLPRSSEYSDLEILTHPLQIFVCVYLV